MGTHLAQLSKETIAAADLKPLPSAAERQMLSRLGRCWQIHGYAGRSLVSLLSWGRSLLRSLVLEEHGKTTSISVPRKWPRRPEQLFFAQPTRENLEIFDQMNRERIKQILGEGSECFLGQELVNEMPYPLAQKFPYLYLYEWGVQYGLEAGKGDFVFASGDGRFAIVEVKYIDGIRRQRSRKRKSVWSQAQRYAVLFRLAAENSDVQFNSVIAFTYTNEDGLIYHGCAYGMAEEFPT